MEQLPFNFDKEEVLEKEPVHIKEAKPVSAPDMDEIYKNRLEDLEGCPRCGNPKPADLRVCASCGGPVNKISKKRS